MEAAVSIDFDLSGGVAVITINRPERLNAMDAEHYAGLSDAWSRVRDEADIRAAVVTGAGARSFSTGADIKSFLAAPPDMASMWLTQREQLLNRGLEVWKPVLAAVNGYCLGGGMTLLLGTDIRYAAPHATFALSEVKRGVIAGNGGTQRILSQLPYAIGMEMLLTGDPIDAETAARWGLINRVVPAGELLEATVETARRIAANAPLALQAAKELAIRAREMPLNAGLRMEQLTNRLLQFTEDAVEGPNAFAEKRPPRFRGA